MYKRQALLCGRSIGRVMFWAAGIAAVEIVGGLTLAYETDSPAGAVIVLGAAALYLLALAVQRWRRSRTRRTGPSPAHDVRRSDQPDRPAR